MRLSVCANFAIFGAAHLGEVGMKRICQLAVVIVMMCWPAMCQAGVDDTGHYVVLGEGTNSCGEWTLTERELRWQSQRLGGAGDQTQPRPRRLRAPNRPSFLGLAHLAREAEAQSRWVD
jgi:hypothetical protein